ncbi:MAG TPA: glycosyltransferase family 4 protein [Bacteriovoracaceae bacterium]|nr:glycosyltransferase family 4 protein [Bacteriovoracaceae bacterium]
MRVLYVSPNGYLGGAEKVVINLAQGHLQENTYDPLILFYSDGEAVNAARDMGIKCIVMTQAFRLSRPLLLCKGLWEIRQIIERVNPQIVHSTMAYSHLTISLASMGLSLKKVWFQHGPVGQLLDKLASFFPVDMLFFNSSFLQKLHHRSLPEVKVRLQEAVICLGVTDQMTSPKTNYSSQLRIGCAGRISRFRSFETVIKALSELKENYPLRPFKLSIAGSPKTQTDHEYYQELVILVETLQLKNDVYFVGHQNDMKEYYKGIDVFIHSAIAPEPFGLAAAEAMSHGCLTIGSDMGGISDFLINDVTGFTYSSAGQLKIILARIFTEDMESFKEVVQAGLEQIHEKHSIQGMTKQVEGLYGVLTLDR